MNKIKLIAALLGCMLLTSPLQAQQPTPYGTDQQALGMLQYSHTQLPGLQTPALLRYYQNTLAGKHPSRQDIQNMLNEYQWFMQKYNRMQNQCFTAMNNGDFVTASAIQQYMPAMMAIRACYEVPIQSLRALNLITN